MELEAAHAKMTGKLPELRAKHGEIVEDARVIVKASCIIELERRASMKLAEKNYFMEKELQECHEEFEQEIFNLEDENIKLKEELREERRKSQEQAKKQAAEIEELKKKLAERDQEVVLFTQRYPRRQRIESNSEVSVIILINYTFLVMTI